MQANWAALLLLFFTLLFLALPTLAQTPPVSTPSALQMDAGERQLFALGMALTQGAFAYAELSKQAAQAGKTRSRAAQVIDFQRLGPAARRDRTAAQEGLAQAVSLLQTLNAPPATLLPIERAATRLGKPLPMTANASILAALSEFTTLSSLPENPALRQWLASPDMSDSAQVWYDEGEICGLAQIAAAHQMPELLPPAEQIATDLRGLRDWLALRLPDTPTPEQISLKSALEAFLQQVALTTRPGIKSRKFLTPTQLQALGSISEQVQTQVLRPAAPAAPQASSART